MAGATPTNLQDSTNVQMQPWKVKGYFCKEIQKMMYGFGDSANPLRESALLIEDIVRQQLMVILTRAAEVAELRESKTIDPEDLLFVMRKDPVLVHRLLKYLTVKEWRRRIPTTNYQPTDNYENDLGMESGDLLNPKPICTYMEYLKSIDQTGELTDPALIPVDIVKHERNVRAERTSRMLSQEKYMEFVQARRTGFVQPRYGSKFNEWVLSAEEKFEINNRGSFDILGFLAYETVAEMVDLALLVRQDSKAKPGDPFSSYVTTPGYSRIPTFPRNAYPTETTALQIEEAPPLSPEEIEEAFRRATSSQFSPFSLFHRNTNSTVDSNILTV